MKLEVKYFPLTQHNPGAMLGSQAAECAADQDAFWPYHDQLFAAATAQGARGFIAENLIDYSEQLGLDRSAFSQCMVSQRYVNLVQDQVSQGIGQGVNSTPSLFINGAKIEEPFDYATITAELNRLLQGS